jgi:hypothetical protein
LQAAVQYLFLIEYDVVVLIDEYFQNSSIPLFEYRVENAEFADDKEGGLRLLRPN